MICVGRPVVLLAADVQGLVLHVVNVGTYVRVLARYNVKQLHFNS